MIPHHRRLISPVWKSVSPFSRGAAIWLLVLLPLLGGCAFDRQWRSMVRQQAKEGGVATTSPADPLAGRWEGKWVSDQSGHTGALRAIITPVNDTTYHVEFDAMFFAILRAGYSLDLTGARDTNNVVNFQGEKDLGELAGGVYRYAGAADGMNFTATYKSSADNGRFEMTRPKR